MEVIKRNKAVTLLICAVTVLMVFGTLIAGTFAANNDYTKTYSNPNPLENRYIQLEVNGGTGTWMYTVTNPNNRLSTEAAVASVASTGLVTAQRAGAVTIVTSTTEGAIVSQNVQVSDSRNISAYTIKKGAEGYIKKAEDTLAIPITTVPETAKNTITWSSLNEDVAVVDADGTITAKTDKGAAIIIGEFTDQWGVDHDIHYLIVIGQNINDSLLGKLMDLLDSAKECEESDYTPDSWADSNLPTVIEEVEELLKNADATEEEYQQAIDDLQEALDKLVSTESGDLSDLIKEIEGLDENQYTPDTWEVLEEELEKAKEVLENPNATQDQIEQAIDDLTAAKDQLKEKADNSALSDLIDEAKKLVETDYTPDSWDQSNLTQVITDAEAVLNNGNATDADVAKAIDDLQAAINELEARADKSGLRDSILIANALEIFKDKYTPNTWDALQAELAKANTVYADDNATQEAVDTAKAALDAAFANLTDKAYKGTLDAAIAKADALTPEDYTSGSFAAVEAALEAAKSVSENLNATQGEVNQAANDLETAMNALVDLSGLNEAVAMGEAINSNDVTPASWTAIQEALTAAKEVQAKSDATQKEVDDAEAALRAAIEAAIPAGDKGELAQAIAEAKAKEESKYTPDSYSELASELADAILVYDNANATPAEIAAATEALKDAIDGLVAKADKSGLIAAIAAGDGMTGTYTPTSKATLDSALAAAKIVNDNQNATQQAVDNAETALRAAIAGLVDTSYLASQITLGSALVGNEASYTPATWTPFKAAYDAALSVMAKGNATQAEVDAAANALAAKMPLTQRANTSGVSAAIAAAEALTAGDYTADTWAKLQEAVTAAKNFLDSGITYNETQAQVDAYATAITNAKNALVASLASTLKGLSVGDEFTADGYTWIVLKKDGSGNMLIITKNIVSLYQFHNEYTNNYEGSTLQTRMWSFYSSNLSELKSYAKPVNLPMGANSTGDTTNLTTVATSGTVTAFALSTADAITTMPTAASRIATYNGTATTWWLRSPGTSSTSARQVYLTGDIGQDGSTSFFGMRPALYINPN